MTRGGIKTNSKFQFSIPVKNTKLSDAATIAIQIGALANKVANIERTRCNHLDGRAENVAEHSLMLAKVAPELATLLYPELDENLVARFATLHDDIEAYVGDTPTDMISNIDPNIKIALEAKGLKQLTSDYSHMPGYVKLIKLYESQSIPEARFVRAVDKLMVLLIQFSNNGSVLRQNYTYETYLECEQELLDRYRFKFGEFDKIISLRRELGQELADQFLKK